MQPDGLAALEGRELLGGGGRQRVAEGRHDAVRDGTVLLPVVALAAGQREQREQRHGFLLQAVPS